MFARGEFPLLTGFNTDVEYNDHVYHVQTEDKGAGNPVLETLIYRGGEILATRRTSYADLIAAGRPDPRRVAERLEAQHQRMVLNVRQGRYDPDGGKPFGSGIISDRSLDQVVLEHLEAEKTGEKIRATVDPVPVFAEGERVELSLRVSGEITGRALSDARVAATLLTPLEKPVSLAEGKTDEQGTFRAAMRLPRLEEGMEGVVLVRVIRGEESVELKWPVRRSGEGRGGE